MNEHQAVQRVYAYLRHELGIPAEAIQREVATSHGTRLDLVVMDGGHIQVICEVKRLDELPQNPELLPFNAVIRQVQFAALDIGARYFLVSDGRQMIWFQTDDTGRPQKIAQPKTYSDLVGGRSETNSQVGWIASARRALRNLLEYSKQERWSPEALVLVLYAYLQRQRGRDEFFEMLVSGSNSKLLQANRFNLRLEAGVGFVETLAFVTAQDHTTSSGYRYALDLFEGAALDRLSPDAALPLLDDVLGRYPTISGATRLPRWISDLVVHLAAIEPGQRILDLHCGLGNLAAAARLASSALPNTMTLYARHATDAMWAAVQQLTFGVEVPSIRLGDPLESNDHSMPQQDMGRILVAPPFGLTVRQDRFNGSRRMSSEEAYLRLALEHLSPTGRIVALIPNGALSSPDRLQLRELLLKNGLQAVIDVGAFQPDSGATASVVVLDKTPPTRDSLFFGKAQNRLRQDNFRCSSLPGLPVVLQRYEMWMKGRDIESDNLGLTATAAPASGVLSVGPYLAAQAQLQLHLESFQQCTLQSIAIVTKGGAIRRSRQGGGTEFIGPGAIRPLEIQLDPRDKAEDSEVERYPNALAREGDIVINGLSTHIGAAALVEHGSYPINRHVYRIRVHSMQVLPEYLAIAINSELVHKALIAGAGGSVMTMLRLDLLKNIPIPVPPLAVQAEIVRRVAVAKSDRNAAAKLLIEKERVLSSLMRSLDLRETA